MYHPSILQAYTFARTQCQSNPIDACTDVADYHGIVVQRLAQFLTMMGVDVYHLQSMV